MTDPVKLAVVRSEPIEPLIQALEELLAKAKTGEIRSIVYLAFDRGDRWWTGNSGDRQNRAYVLGAFQQAGLDYYHRRRQEDG